MPPSGTPRPLHLTLLDAVGVRPQAGMAALSVNDAPCCFSRGTCITNLTTACGGDLLLLNPQAERWEPTGTLHPPIGSIAWVDLSSAPGAGLYALEYLEAFPWVQVLAAGQGALVATLQGRLPSPDRVTACAGPLPSASEARRRIDGSRVPPHATIAT